MEPQTKSTNPTENEILKVLRQLKKTTDAFSKFAVDLTPQDRRHILKGRRGGENVSDLIAQIADERKLSVSKSSPSDILNHHKRAKLLKPVRAAASSLLKTLDDAILVAESQAWWGTTAYYTALRGMARSDGTLKEMLEPATAFFALGRRKPKVAAAK